MKLQQATLVRSANGVLPLFTADYKYPVRYELSDGASLCALCANGAHGSRAHEVPGGPDMECWRIVASYIHMIGPDEECTNCGLTWSAELAQEGCAA